MKKIALSLLGLIFVLAAGCSSGPEIKTQKYAKYKQEKVFESEFPKVWKAIEGTFSNYKIVERDPEEVSPTELEKLQERTLTTDWIYTRSKDKYVEYKVNGLPRKKPLQMRNRYRVTAISVLGGTQVTVSQQEELETLDDHGNPSGYEEVGEPDSGRSKEILERVKQGLL